MKLYTKCGDHGTTSLIGGERVAKCDPRVEAYGTVDELSAFMALLGDKLAEFEVMADCTAEIRRICSTLMCVESLLAMGIHGCDKVAPLSNKPILDLEAEIDRLQESLRPITHFTIPGGCTPASLCHVCRTVCRRAERRAIEAAEKFNVPSEVTAYLNRLSDYLYALGRTITERLSVEEILWQP
ncbi:MAG: cob(I)yrinic acid a,c-diamide adenosyltransferase [Alistipes sp.]|nr:cob(I)yrinic acid a,c-diamide adenosyltransferase [Alistipes sp.]